MTCHSCGGVIGRDCFNPQECAEITHQMEMQAEQDRQFVHEYGPEMQRLSDENAKLRATISQLCSTSDDLACPFCNETGFDHIGLKSHLLRDCEPFSNTENLERLF